MKLPSSSMRLVELLFAVITIKRMPRRVFRSISGLEELVRDYLDHHNPDRKPFVQTKTADTTAKERSAKEKPKSLNRWSQPTKYER